MTTYVLELAQTLYWSIEIEVDGEHDIEDVIHDAEPSRRSELDNHYSCADKEVREAKVLTKEGEHYDS